MFPYKAGRPFRYDPAAKKGKTPPACPGEYRIRNARRELQYIGETNDLSRRMKEHIASGKLPLDGSVFDYMPADGRSASRTRRAHEQRSIKKHAPPAQNRRLQIEKPLPVAVKGAGKRLLCMNHRPRRRCTARGMVALGGTREKVPLVLAGWTVCHNNGKDANPAHRLPILGFCYGRSFHL